MGKSICVQEDIPGGARGTERRNETFDELRSRLLEEGRESVRDDAGLEGMQPKNSRSTDGDEAGPGQLMALHDSRV